MASPINYSISKVQQTVPLHFSERYQLKKIGFTNTGEDEFWTRLTYHDEWKCNYIDDIEKYVDSDGSTWYIYFGQADSKDVNMKVPPQVVLDFDSFQDLYLFLTTIPEIDGDSGSNVVHSTKEMITQMA